MKRLRYVEPLAEFARRALAREGGLGPPYRALFLTYDLNLEIFERDVLPVLARRNRAFRTVVIRDASTPIVGRPGASYELRAAHIKGGAFHPKLWLLQAGARWCIGIGSSNLTPGGFGGNLEMMSVTEGGPDWDDLHASVRQFLRQLADGDQVVLDPPTRRVLRTFAGPISTRQLGGSALSTLSGPMLDQMVRPLRHRDVCEVHVVSPPYAGQLNEDAGLETQLVGALRSRCPQATISIYTEAGGRLQGAHTFTYGAGDGDKTAQEARISADAEGEAEEALGNAGEWPSGLHAKIYLFVTSHRRWRLCVGSANFTVPALLSKLGKGGNVELVRAEDLTPRDGRGLLRALTALFSRVDGGKFHQLTKARLSDASRVLSGWEEHGIIHLGLKRAVGVGPITLIGPSGKRVLVRPTGDAVVLTRQQITNLGLSVPLEVPVRLEEIVGRRPHPFFVSPSVVAPLTTGTTMVEKLTSVADELEGVRIRSFGSRPTSEPLPDPPAVDRDEDPVSALTVTAHDGELDVLAKLLARIASLSRGPAELRARLDEAGVSKVEEWVTLSELRFSR